MLQHFNSIHWWLFLLVFTFSINWKLFICGFETKFLSALFCFTTEQPSNTSMLLQQQFVPWTFWEMCKSLDILAETILINSLSNQSESSWDIQETCPSTDSLVGYSTLHHWTTTPDVRAVGCIQVPYLITVSIFLAYKLRPSLIIPVNNVTSWVVLNDLKLILRDTCTLNFNTMWHIPDFVVLFRMKRLLCTTRTRPPRLFPAIK